MRLFCELFLAAVLIWLGWTKSFQDRINQMRGIEPPPAVVAHQTQVRQALADGSTTTAASAPAAAPAPRQPFLRQRPAPTPSGDWMWDPAHRNPLDKPAFKTGNAQAQSEAPAGNYWIDARGVRPYTNAPPPPAGTTPP